VCSPSAAAAAAAHRKTPKTLEASNKNDTPPLKKKSVSLKQSLRHSTIEPKQYYHLIFFVSFTYFAPS
jgi:hypothetical protein